MNELRVTHVLPRWHFGGGAKEVLCEASYARARNNGISLEVTTLERDASVALMREAVRAKLRVRLAPAPDLEEQLLTESDVVVLNYWNTPAIRRFLDRWRGRRLRWILNCQVNTLHQPQRLPSRLAETACHVILTSPHAKDNIYHDRVSVIPAPIQFPTAELKPRIERSTKIMTAGTLNVFKLSAHFVPLHAGLVDATDPIVVVGSGGDEQRFQADAEALGVADQFRWRGFSHDLNSIYASAHLLSYPAAPFTYASSDKVIQESQIAGTPVLVHAKSAVAHLIRDGVTGFLATSDEDFRNKLTAFSAGRLPAPDPHDVNNAASVDHDPDRKCATRRAIYRQVAVAEPREIDDGFPALVDWMDFQVGDPIRAAAYPRPPLTQLRQHEDVLLAHQCWACEGGLAQYLKHFPELKDWAQWTT